MATNKGDSPWSAATMLSLGTVVSFAGGVAMLFGLATGLTELFQLPYWASLLILGSIAILIGVTFVRAGTTEAAVEVSDTLTVTEQVRQRPITALATAVVLGVVAHAVIRRLFAKPDPLQQATDAAKRTAQTVGETAQAAGEKAQDAADGLWGFFREPLERFGEIASNAAVSIGLQAVGVDKMQEFVTGLFENKPSDNTASPASEESPKVRRYDPAA